MKKILLVEDDASLCRGISFKLKRKAMRCSQVPTVNDAIVIFENNKIDLVISDITLEDGDGYELCQKLDKIVTCFLYSLLHWIKK